jgi:hypothetical protein
MDLYDVAKEIIQFKKIASLLCINFFDHFIERSDWSAGYKKRLREKAECATVHEHFLTSPPGKIPQAQKV